MTVRAPSAEEMRRRLLWQNQWTSDSWDTSRLTRTCPVVALREVFILKSSPTEFGLCKIMRCFLNEPLPKQVELVLWGDTQQRAGRVQFTGEYLLLDLSGHQGVSPQQEDLCVVPLWDQPCRYPTLVRLMSKTKLADSAQLQTVAVRGPATRAPVQHRALRHDKNLPPPPLPSAGQLLWPHSGASRQPGGQAREVGGGEGGEGEQEQLGLRTQANYRRETTVFTLQQPAPKFPKHQVLNPRNKNKISPDTSGLLCKLINLLSWLKFLRSVTPSI